MQKETIFRLNNIIPGKTGLRGCILIVVVGREREVSAKYWQVELFHISFQIGDKAKFMMLFEKQNKTHINI